MTVNVRVLTLILCRISMPVSATWLDQHSMIVRSYVRNDEERRMTLLQCNKLPGHLTVLELPRSLQHIPQDCNAAAEAQALWFRTHPRQKVRQLHACRRSIHGYRYQDEFLYECFAARHANESSSFWQKCRLAPASKGCMAETTARPARRAIVRQQRSTSSPTPAAPRKAPAPSKPHAHPPSDGRSRFVWGEAPAGVAGFCT